MIGRYATAMLDRGLSPATVKRRTLTLTRFARWLGGEAHLLAATDDQCDRWLSSLRIQAHSRGMYLGDLRAFYRWALRWQLVQRNPTDLLEPPSRPRRIPRPIATADLVMALRMAQDERILRTLVIAAFAGLRISEITSLDAADTDLDSRCIIVRGKGNAERSVPMHDQVLGVLSTSRRGPVIQAIGGGPITPLYLGQLVARHMDGLSIRARTHNCRHWFATETYRACRDMRVVQELLGHADPKTTAGYVAVSGERSRAAVEALTLPDFALPLPVS